MKKGVLLINGILPPPYGGIAKYLSWFVDEYQKELDLFLVYPDGYTIDEYILNKYSKLNIFLTNKTKIGKTITIIKYSKFIIETYLKYKIPFRHIIKSVYTWLPHTDLIIKNNLDRIDYIHVFDQPFVHGFIGLYLANKYNKKSILQTYGEIFPHEKELVTYDAYSIQFQGFVSDIVFGYDQIASMTNHCAKELLRIDYSLKKVKFIHHVTGPLTYDKLNDESDIEFNFPSNKKMVLFVGQLQRRKGPDILLGAAIELLKQRDDVYFAFAGPDSGLYDEMIKSSSSNTDSIFILGSVTDSQLYTLYDKCDIFVFPTVSNIECLGLVFIQAMFFKKPVIASSIAACPEVIGKEEFGLLFTPGLENELRKKIIYLLDNPEKAEDIGENGYKRVKELYSINVLRNQIKELYSL